MAVTKTAYGNINAQEMKTEIPKISNSLVGNENTGYAQYVIRKARRILVAGKNGRRGISTNYRITN